MGKDDALAIAAGNTEIGFPCFSGTVDDTAHDGYVEGLLNVLECFFYLFGQVDELDLRAAARGTADQSRAKLTQA